MAEDITNQYEPSDEYIEGFPITGEEVANAEDKTFEILEKPYYEEFQDREKEQAKRKLVLTISFNGDRVTYYPNKTSIGKIVKKVGRRLEEWVGFKGEFETVKMNVGGETKDVIQIKEK